MVKKMLMPLILFAALLVALPMFVGGAAACAPDGALSGPGLKVLTWNVCGSSCGDWDERSPLAAQQIARLSPDVVALQEGGWSSTKRGYTFEAMKKAGYDTASNKEPFIGRYIFFRRQAFTVEGSGSFSLGGHHGMAWTTLTPTGTEETFTVVNVHLTYPKSADAERASQMREGMAKLAEETRGHPVIYAGDFNSNKSRADDAPARIMGDAGFVDTVTIAASKTNDDVNSARDRDVDAAVQRDGNQTDHIYVSKAGAKVSEWRHIVNAGDDDRYRAPFISDHNPIAASIVFDGIEPMSADVSSLTAAQPLTAASKFNAEQLRNAGLIIAAGRSMSVPERGQVIAVMTALGESSLRVVDHGDAAGPDSRGLFQQRDSWGPYEDRMDPTKSAGLFYKALLEVDGWEELEPTEAAHRVQRNADPGHYEKYWEDAKTIYAQVSGSDLLDVDAMTSTGCPTGDLQQASFGSGADCDFQAVRNPRTCAEALQAAAQIAAESPCTAPSHLAGGTWRRWCLAFVAIAYGRDYAGYHTAMDMYRAMKARGLISTSKEIPPGALVFFSSSSSAGHVALYNGDGKAWSNDYIRSGCIDLTPMSTMGSGGRYLGWSPPDFPG